MCHVAIKIQMNSILHEVKLVTGEIGMMYYVKLK